MAPAQIYMVTDYKINDREFGLFRELIYAKAGIYLAETKKGLVQGRLTKRLRYYQLRNFSEYYDLVHANTDGVEMQMLVDLLTTNETYFFREHKHFDFISKNIVPQHKNSRSLKIWSAACSSGEEPYSIAMLLADKLGTTGNWHIFATDLNQQILENAKRGLYSMTAAEKLPTAYLRSYCLKGTGQYSEYFLVDKSIKENIHFHQLNLNGSWVNVGLYDLIVLRNVMIYFDKPTRQRLVSRIAEKLNPKGYLFVSHAETLSGISDRFKCVQPAIYQLK